MGTTVIIFGSALAVSLVANFLLAFMLKGALTTDEETRGQVKSGIKTLTGREIETIRRKLASVGVRAMKLSEYFSMILTLRLIQTGRYEDEDPWIPPNIYEDIDIAIDGLPE